MPVEFSWVDWVLLAIVALSALLSLTRGFLREVLSLAIWIAASVLSIMFHEKLAVLLQPHIGSPSLTKIAAIGLLFVLCLIMGGLISFVLSKLIKVTGLTATDRLLGTVFGALRGVVVIVVILMVGRRMLPLDQEQWWQQSVLIPHFSRLEEWVVQAALALKELVMPFLSGLI